MRRPAQLPKARIPAVLAVAGLEPTGRAGLLADIEAIRKAGGIAVGIASALTAQGRQTFAVSPVPPSVLGRQLRAIAEMGPLFAVKVGMLPRPAALSLLLRAVPRHAFWVIDPVTRTSRGQRLSMLRPADYLRAAGPRMVLTPNLAEAAWLLGEKSAPRGVEEMARAGERLCKLGFAAVIIKGGHLVGQAVDVLVDEAGPLSLHGERISRPADSRGTGCRFASVLATALARGEALADAAREAKSQVRAYLLSAKSRPKLGANG